jgi:hypothetical protein
MNRRRLHMTIAGTPGSVLLPWISQDVGYASRGSATFMHGYPRVSENGALSLHKDLFGRFQDHLAHDAFHYVFQGLDGNGEPTAQFLGPSAGVNPLAGSRSSADLMLRESNFVIGETKGSLCGRCLRIGDTFTETTRYGYLGAY